jgi:NCS1 family nucleobase:cation symporter-1
MDCSQLTSLFQILAALWPSFKTLPNSLPDSAGITTAGMIAYFLYWLAQFPLLLIPTHKLQYMFWVKTILTPPMAIGMVSLTTRGLSAVVNYRNA